MLEVGDALRIVLQQARALPPQQTADLLGKTLAEDIHSDVDSPPFDKSLMDGYAVRAVDTAADVRLSVIEQVAAGQLPTRPVGPGQTTHVMTGAPVPVGADAVIPHEHVALENEQILLRSVVPVGQYILPLGQEMRSGARVLPAGTLLTPAAIGLLAAVGRTTVLCHPRPRVAVISTGDELVDVEKFPGPGQIRNTNGPMLLALARSLGVDAQSPGIARDDPALLRDWLRDALATVDAVLLSGGVSAGSFDFVPGVLAELGAEIHFHKLNLKPGKPLLFGTRGQTLVFGLPGNPVSSFVGFELFVRPAIRRLARESFVDPCFVSTPLGEPLSTRNDRPTYLPGRLEIHPAGPRVRPGRWFGSADLRSLLTTNALIRVPAGEIDLPEGASVACLALSHGPVPIPIPAAEPKT